jgi:hypothetical protein
MKKDTITRAIIKPRMVPSKFSNLHVQTWNAPLLVFVGLTPVVGLVDSDRVTDSDIVGIVPTTEKNFMTIDGLVVAVDRGLIWWWCVITPSWSDAFSTEREAASFSEPTGGRPVPEFVCSRARVMVVEAASCMQEATAMSRPIGEVDMVLPASINAKEAGDLFARTSQRQAGRERLVTVEESMMAQSSAASPPAVVEGRKKEKMGEVESRRVRPRAEIPKVTLK